ncbi:MAG: hypothetical protein INR81_05405 [Microcystis aeruginosa PMC 728.11]|nr:hypothetical protein [Microcystis aeruginosa PMC 728.11]TRU01787.1 MAG: hypothetical protein EWV62_01245 [Microcystis aeruginosa Ma_OC_LR_19540900_S633]
MRDIPRSNINSILPNIGGTMSDLSVTVRMADGTRKAAVTLPATLTVDQIVSTTQSKWNLPANVDYAVRLQSTGQQLEGATSLASAGVQNDDVLEVYPILEAG